MQVIVHLAFSLPEGAKALQTPKTPTFPGPEQPCNLLLRLSEMSSSLQLTTNSTDIHETTPGRSLPHQLQDDSKPEDASKET
ncbi:hypothetical protein GE061_009334 [Apolygus lucorum]|uniref:Uncharacterized protein n=1 Tax=Apolygus lucorum TaxID=248454 RepID=A0A8S9Y203_APOLU|nr:hypothetical protein GE061_009334 [Apolygus lucorum]